MAAAIKEGCPSCDSLPQDKKFCCWWWPSSIAPQDKTCANCGNCCPPQQTWMRLLLSAAIQWPGLLLTTTASNKTVLEIDLTTLRLCTRRQAPES